MKLKYAVILIIFAFALVPVSAQIALYRPFTSFRVIRTNHFDIIFPQKSERSARYLATFADSVYEQMTSLLGIEVPGRIPVTFAPHTDMFNGYYHPLSNHIVLFDTPMDIEWSTFSHNLRGLFIHELVHAISLNSRSPSLRFMHRIFGNWTSPVFINASLFMIEGVSVSFESLDGTGRVNDPRFKQYLRQAVIEGEFLSPFQASGIFDRPIQPRGYFYIYGGFFSAWLQQNFGMEKYAHLWQAMGEDLHLSFSVYRSGFYRIFRRIYGIDFLEAWNAFRDTFAIDVEINNDEILPRQQRFFSEREQSIRGMAARGNELFFIDRTNRRIGIYDTAAGEMRSINTDPFVYDIDVSQDGRFLLLSSYRFIEDRAVAVATEHRTDNGRRTGRSFQGIYRARFFRSGIIGIASDLHNNKIVYEDFNGNREILLHGNQTLMFSGPQVIDDERIAVIVSRNGKRELWLFNYLTRELFRVEFYGEEEPDDRHWHYMRNLRAFGDKLFFSHNADNRMYKLAYIDLETMQAVFSGRDFSGGVFDPVPAGGNIYYHGSFVFTDRLLRFPEPANAVSGARKNLQMVRLDHQNYQAAQMVNFPQSDLPSRRYFALRYMSPFNFWFPLPLLRFSENNISLDGGGLASFITDPTDRNQIILLAYYDVPYRMAMIEHFSWQNTALGFPLTVNFSDSVVESTASRTFRRTSVTLDGSLLWSYGQWVYRVNIGGGFLRIADEPSVSWQSAYQWEETNSDFYVFGGLALSYRRMFLSLRGVSFTDSFEPRIDGVFGVRTATRFPMHFTFFGAYDPHGMDLHGGSSFSPLFANNALIEFSSPTGLSINWLGGGEMAVDLFSFEIQRHISHLYFNRFTGSLAFRNQIYDSMGHPQAEGIKLNDDLRLLQSMKLRLGMTMSFFPIIKNPPITIEPQVWGAWKFSNTIARQQNQWDWGFGLTVSALF